MRKAPTDRATALKAGPTATMACLPRRRRAAASPWLLAAGALVLCLVLVLATAPQPTMGDVGTAGGGGGGIMATNSDMPRRALSWLCFNKTVTVSSPWRTWTWTWGWGR
ncbi:hypothetical protein PLESTB_001110800 [Pleodorina starrii]|uniref:Uncharacterized protein n=1 Tax=Pleodorina starrii TaxID=330485 RepID=A0A9W6BQE0_9CHLO|nr:hypothetical protein PLESTM_001347800 [Pleodorina starrii]GLC56471.1 hypothetical protein PLESTB_001110800 [Pleodorina starrii]GLC65952.1 hypothetical protein PLESTF_000365800 [Pleodorina starrii]